MLSVVRTATPIMHVPDVRAVLDWYVANLGAKDDWIWGEDKSYGGCMLGHASLHFCASSEKRPLSLFITVANVRAMFESCQQRGVPITHTLERQPWDAMEFVVHDPHGVELRFAEFGHPVERREPVEEVELVWREPSFEEYKALVEAVGWSAPKRGNDLHSRGLSHTVLALHQGALIGMASITGNGVDDFTVRDVVVLPEYQGRGVGRRLMGAVREWMDTHVTSPGAYVTLLTGTVTTAFYEQFGFVGPDKGLVGMYWKKPLDQ